MSESARTRVVPVRRLRPGLYVCELDRPWVETPFAFQGFRIAGGRDLELLATYCRHCHVDLERSDPEAVAALGDDAPDDAPASAAQRHESPPELAGAAGVLFESVAYPDPERFATLVRAAGVARAQARDAVRAAIDALGGGRSVDVERAGAAVDGMLRLVRADPSPLLWLTALRGHEPYAVTHGLNASALALAFGVHLEMDDEALHQLGLGTLLMDVGKIAVPREVLSKRRQLSTTEMAFVRRHVGAGHARLARAGLPGEALEIVRLHHERLDGSGYPAGLAGDRIPRQALIAGIADTYDAMLSWRPYRFPHRPEHALKRMHDRAAATFGRALVEQFIRCIGTFPVGSLVELDNRAIAIVAGSQPGVGLWPTVLLLRAPGGEWFDKRVLVNLRAANEGDTEIAGRSIRRSILESEADVDVAEVVAHEFGLGVA